MASHALLACCFSHRNGNDCFAFLSHRFLYQCEVTMSVSSRDIISTEKRSRLLMAFRTPLPVAGRSVRGGRCTFDVYRPKLPKV